MKHSSFKSRVITVLAGALFTLPSLASACPMCMGAADGKTGPALNGAIFLLLGCIGSMLAFIVTMAVKFSARARLVESSSLPFNSFVHQDNVALE